MPLTDKQRVEVESCKRCFQVGQDYDAQVPAGSMFSIQFSDLGTGCSAVDTAVGVMDAARSETNAQVDIKEINRGEVTDLLDSIARAARAAEPAHPGYQARFRYDRNLAGQDLLGVMASFLTASPTEQSDLEDWGAPTGWHATLAAAKTLWQNSLTNTAASKDAKAAARADVQAKIDYIKQKKKTIEHMIPNYFDGPAKAAWASAAHVEKLPVHHRTPKPPPTP